MLDLASVHADADDGSVYSRESYEYNDSAGHFAERPAAGIGSILK